MKDCKLTSNIYIYIYIYHSMRRSTAICKMSAGGDRVHVWLVSVGRGSIVQAAVLHNRALDDECGTKTLRVISACLISSKLTSFGSSD